MEKQEVFEDEIPENSPESGASESKQPASEAGGDEASVKDEVVKEEVVSDKPSEAVETLGADSGESTAEPANGDEEVPPPAPVRKRREAKRVLNVKVLKRLSGSFLHFLSTFLSIVMVVLCIFIFYSAIASPAQNGTAVGPFMFFNVTTGSMYPTIKVGTLICTKAIPQEELQIGDIITYQVSEDANDILTHRIVRQAIEPDFFITRGDANNTDDNPVHYNNIIGKVIFGIPALGFVISAAKSPLGCAIVIAVFVLIMVSVEVIKKLIKE